jgi:hypothetical protein
VLRKFSHARSTPDGRTDLRGFGCVLCHSLPRKIDSGLTRGAYTPPSRFLTPLFDILVVQFIFIRVHCPTCIFLMFFRSFRELIYELFRLLGADLWPPGNPPLPSRPFLPLLSTISPTLQRTGPIRLHFIVRPSFIYSRGVPVRFYYCRRGVPCLLQVRHLFCLEQCHFSIVLNIDTLLSSLAALKEE